MLLSGQFTHFTIEAENTCMTNSIVCSHILRVLLQLSNSSIFLPVMRTTKNHSIKPRSTTCDADAPYSTFLEADALSDCPWSSIRVLTSPTKTDLIRARATDVCVLVSIIRCKGGEGMDSTRRRSGYSPGISSFETAFAIIAHEPLEQY